MTGPILWTILYLANGDIDSYLLDVGDAKACEILLKGAEQDMAFRHQKGRVICLPRNDLETTSK